MPTIFKQFYNQTQYFICMDRLASVRRTLIDMINAHQPNGNSPAISVFSLRTALFAEPLGWLKAQTVYPQFYLHLRNGKQKLAALGKVRSFFDTNSAQDFVLRHNLTLVGGLTFDGQSDFFLPRLLVQQENNETVVSLFIDNQQDLNAEKQAALQVLEHFASSVELHPVGQSVQHIEQSANQTQWCDWVNNALDTFKRTELNKVVLANKTLFHTQQALNAKDFLAASEQHNGGCYHFLFAQNIDRTFFGSSPERLYRRQNNLLETEALAGTAMMSDDCSQNQAQGDWLLHDEKNVYENWLVVEDICHNLNVYADKIEIAELELKQLRQVQHLRRKIQVQLKPHYGDSACLSAIHPTAAVCGLPRQAAVRFIQNTENFDRTWYAGTLGFMQAEQAEFCVTIRSAFIEGNKISVFAGAGIVEGSVPLLEWQEIERKAAGLISLLKHKNNP